LRGHRAQSDAMTRLRPAVLPLLAAILVTGLASVLAWVLAGQLITARLRAELDQTLLLTSRAVQAEIDRFRALPEVAGEDARIRAALTDPSALDSANRYLETISAHAGASELFLIDDRGLTIAASNWAQPGSFVGQDYGFRPYFRQAMQQGSGQFYAIGVTTGVPGFFLSTRVSSGVSAGGQTGVLVVKLDLRSLQQTWRTAGADVALVDAAGVVFLSGREDWLYRPLAPLTPEGLSELAQTRAYDGVDLAGADPLLPRAPLGADATGSDWIARLSSLSGTGWRLIAARPASAVTRAAAGWAVATALLALFVAGLFHAWDQRRQIVALRLSQSQKLEAMVATRTADLGREVEARRQAEADLRATQENLIHAEKMAALGRMSTAIVHEISQPLAAMEATLTSAELSMPPGETAIAPRLATARGLIRRMQRTIKHLKSFGRKEAGERSVIDLRQALASALELVTPRARAVGVTPRLVLPDESALVLAGSVRMEQVVVNLLLNALDAVEGRKDADIALQLSISAGEVALSVRDNGHGIAPEAMSRVTEPFFSTRTGGEGLGLGLSICKAIVTEFGGALTIVSDAGQGATVTVTLPRVQPVAEEAAE
jgi:two-component system C4-dicarboxylate transport sensor histidine kinase DctB